MFSVYGLSGRVFRGSLDELRKVSPVRGAKTAPVAAGAVFSLDVPASAPVQDLPPRDVRQEAMQAYAQAQKPDSQRHPLTRVDELMSRAVVTLPMDLSLIDAWQRLAQQRIGQAPVVDANQVLVGLLSRADLLQPDRLPAPDQNALVWRAFLQQQVADVMLTPVPSVAPDTDVRRVARVLLDAGLSGLPVVQDDGQVQGFISRSDILRAVVTDPPLDLWG
jgi:CBS domain-containing protein